MRYPKLILVLGVMLVAFALPTNVHAVIVMTLGPSPQTIPQGSTATYHIHMITTHAATPFSLDVSGVAGYFSANPVTTDAGGSADVDFVADATTLPSYCPGTYTFTITASGAGDTAQIGGQLIVSQVGPPLQVTVSTDKPAYRAGDTIRIYASVSRAAEGQVVITGPTGQTAYVPFATYSADSGLVKTLTASAPFGTYTVTAQADDYCSGYSSASTTFTVSPDTYDVTISLSGVPSQFSAQLQVDGQNQGTVPGSQSKKFSFKIDTSHTITVEQYVAGDTGVRYYCAQNTWSVSSADSHTFNYQTQYQLTVVTDPDGITPVTGGGWYNEGASVQTNQVNQTVKGTGGTQYAFKTWEVDGVAQTGNPITVTMDKPHRAVAKYATQYQLVIDSPGGLGNPQGGGYYDAGSKATFSVTTPVGFLVQQVFVRWEGDYSGTSPQGSITMDKPKVVHAVWTTSYTQAYVAAGAAAVAIVAAAFLMMRRRKRGPRPPKPSKPSKGKRLGLRIGKPEKEPEKESE